VNTTRRPSLRRAVASVLSGALIAAAALVGVAAPAQAAVAPELTAVTTVTANTGISVAVTGAGFDNVPKLPGQSAPSVYLAFVERDSLTVSQTSTPNTSSDVTGAGEISGVLTQTAAHLDRTASYDVIAWPSRSEPSTGNLLARTAVSIDWAALFPAASTSTTLTVSGASAVLGSSVTLSATVSPAAAGSVAFLDGATSLGTSATNGSGVAELSTTTLAQGAHAITATFTPADAAAYSGSTSSAVSVEITAVPTTPELPTPSVSVSKATGLDSAGETITVTGAGLVANAPATDGTRPPLAGAFAGAYVVFGYYDGDTWVSAGRTPAYTKWGVHAGDLAKIGGEAAGGIVIGEDGSFSTELSAIENADAPEGARFGVRTYAAGGSTYAAFNTFTEVTFAEQTPTFDPEITVYLADGVTPYTNQAVAEGDTLVVKGSGFDPAANVGGMGVPIPSTLPQGTFVVFGSFADQWQPSTGAASSTRTMNAQSRVWALAEDVLDQVPSQFQSTIRASWAPIDATGAFEAHVVVTSPASPLADGNWGVYTYPGGVGTPANAAQELSIPVNFRAATEPETPVEPEVPAGPQVTVTPSAPLDPTVENVLTVTGSGFTGAGAANGAYVVFGETSVWSGGAPLPADGWVQLGWVMPNQIVDGAFTTTITIPAGTLDASTSYQVATSAAHALSATDRTLDTFTPVAVAQIVVEEPTIYLSAPSVVQGGALTVRGAGFAPGATAVVTVHSDPFTLGTATVAADGTFSVLGTVPAGFEAGAHTVRVAVDGAVVATAALTVTAAPAVVDDEEPAQPSCVAQAVSGASITWNVKSSFREYVVGPIANGSYTINWGSGSGAYNTDEDRGRVSFGGSAHFTGHSGALDLTISNPRIQVYSSGSAVLIANISSKAYGDSPAVNASGVAIANLSLPSATVSGGTIRWSGASATLTAAGAKAFAGFYEAGTSLDPVSFTFPLGAEVPCDTTTSGELASTGGTAPVDVLWLGLGMLVLGAGIYAARRRAARV